jgi:hypothetical protein
MSRKQYKKKNENDDEAHLSILDTFQGESVRKMKD